MTDREKTPLSREELAAELATPLPDKRVLSLLDLNVDVDLMLDLAAPIDLAVAGNLNVAAPIDAAVGANVLSEGSSAQALSDQGVLIEQGIAADAVATSNQDSAIDQADTVPAPPVEAVPTDPAAALDGPLLDVNVDINADADIAAPIAGAVALNANIAAPIDAAVAANIGSNGSEATAIAQQEAIISQNIEGTAQATADQQSGISQ